MYNATLPLVGHWQDDVHHAESLGFTLLYRLSSPPGTKYLVVVYYGPTTSDPALPCCSSRQQDADPCQTNKSALHPNG